MHVPIEILQPNPGQGLVYRYAKDNREQGLVTGQQKNQPVTDERQYTAYVADQRNASTASGYYLFVFAKAFMRRFAKLFFVSFFFWRCKRKTK
jgi:hypothetical protein